MDVDKISIDNLGSLSNLTLKGIRCNGVITRVVDGDTYEIALGVTVADLCYKTCCAMAHQSVLSETIILKIKCRLKGVDAAEMKTEQGQEARELVIRWFQQRGNKVWVETEGNDKYGRILASVWDRTRKEDIGTYLLCYKGPNGPIAKPYQ